MSLSPKQEVFCQCIVSGMSGKDSYLKAYNTSCKDQVAYNESSKLLLNPAIQERIAAIRKPLEKAAQIKALNARDQQIDYIKQRIALCEQKEDEQSILRYTDMLNKIHSLYKDQEENKKEENTLDNIDTNTLLKLVK